MSTAELPVQMFDMPPRRAGNGTEWRPILLRMPVEMLQHIDRCADAMYRTRTAEILLRLQESIEGESFDDHGVIVTRSAAAAK